MTPDAWRRAGALFHEALETDPADLSRWAAEACGDDPEVLLELKELLASDRKARGFVEEQVKAGVLQMAGAEGKEQERVGPYTILRKLGEGGMGAVYLARRDDAEYQLDVAIKLVKPGMDTAIVLDRFRRERQTLASMQHPNVARLLEGGTTPDGVPYIVMEYIDGEWITQYCRRLQLPLEARLRLFLPICAAVAYAHRKFIVHRDIKPGNILVTADGTPKLLDFGICKLLMPDAGDIDITVDMGGRLLTPDYASPEQVRGQTVTIVSDVYSLGALLYELLTGAKPLALDRLSVAEMERTVCEQQPAPPSARVSDPAQARRLAGDLDTILLRALHKDPARRYPTVEAFAEDLERYLRHEPVRARPDSTSYRVGKFLRRHRWAVAGTAISVVAIGVAAGEAVYQARLAGQRLQEVRRLANVFVFDVHDAVRDLPGSTKARQLIVQTGLDYLRSIAALSRGDRALQLELAAAYMRVGDVQGGQMNANLGDHAGARASYAQAKSLFQAVLAQDPGEQRARLGLADLAGRAGQLCKAQGDSAGARQEYRDGIATVEPLYREAPQTPQLRRKLADLHLGLGYVTREMGDDPEGLRENAAGLALLVEEKGAAPGDAGLLQAIGSAASYLAVAELRQGHNTDALRHFQEAAEMEEKLAAGAADPAGLQRELMFTWGHIGDTYNMNDIPAPDSFAASKTAFERAVALAEKLYLADRADERAVSDYGILLTRYAGIFDTASLPLFDKAVRLLEEARRRNPDSTQTRQFLAMAYNGQGRGRAAAGQTGAALMSWRQGLELAESNLREDGRTSASIVIAIAQEYGTALARAGRRAEAETLAGRAWEIADPKGQYALRRRPNLIPSYTARGYTAAGRIHAALGNRARAAAELKNAEAAWNAVASTPFYTREHRALLEQTRRTLATLSSSKGNLLYDTASNPPRP